MSCLQYPRVVLPPPPPEPSLKKKKQPHRPPQPSPLPWRGPRHKLVKPRRQQRGHRDRPYGRKEPSRRSLHCKFASGTQQILDLSTSVLADFGCFDYPSPRVIDPRRVFKRRGSHRCASPQAVTPRRVSAHGASLRGRRDSARPAASRAPTIRSQSRWRGTCRGPWCRSYGWHR
jgi:hypothetical protein